MIDFAQLPAKDKIYYKDDAVVIYCADCRDILPLFPDKSFDLVLTDPPYGLNYKEFEWDKSVPYDLLPILLNLCKGAILWFASSPELARDLINFNPKPDRTLIWSPRFTLSHTIKQGIAYRYQPIHCWNIPKDHNVAWDVLDTPTECGNEWKHYATKPLDLIKLLASMCSEVIILDPFLGSGTTAVASKILGRKCVGIEISEKYCEIARNRCLQSVMQLDIPKEDVKQEQLI